jgi:hypothetical protein
MITPEGCGKGVSSVVRLSEQLADLPRCANAKRAGGAEDNALYAISFAIAAVQEAEYAVLEATLARADASAADG